MTDIVERLRELAGWGRIDVAARTVMDEAADEIERLREVVAQCDAEIADLHDQLLRSEPRG